MNWEEDAAADECAAEDDGVAIDEGRWYSKQIYRIEMLGFRREAEFVGKNGVAVDRWRGRIPKESKDVSGKDNE